MARGIHDKLVHRHPHVFGSVEAESAEQVLVNWEQIKKAEKGRSSVMEGMPGDLPALLYAHKVQRKAASVGFDWDDVDGALPKIAEELDELQTAIASAVDRDIEDELGDLLFAVVNVARHLDIDPETALRGAAREVPHPLRAGRGAGQRRGARPVDDDPRGARRPVGPSQALNAGYPHWQQQQHQQHQQIRAEPDAGEAVA